MNQNYTVNINKRIRGEILTALYSANPIPMEIRTIINILIERNMITVPDLARHIDYLTGKGYMRVIDADDAEKVLRGVVPPSAFVKLTPLGTDLVEATIEDPGIDV